MGVRAARLAAFKFQSQFLEVPMKLKSISRILMVVTPAMIVCAVLGLGASAVAQSRSRGSGGARCSNRTLSGDYGAQIEGTILGPNLPLRTISMGHYDGSGNMTSVDHVVLNGMPPQEEWRQGSGTYSVNPDCTGTFSVFTGPDNPPIVVHFVLVKHGTEIHGVVNGAAITFIAFRVD